MQKVVTVIPATRNMHTGTPKAESPKRKVAGYARLMSSANSCLGCRSWIYWSFPLMIAFGTGRWSGSRCLLMGK